MLSISSFKFKDGNGKPDTVLCNNITCFCLEKKCWHKMKKSLDEAQGYDVWLHILRRSDQPRAQSWQKPGKECGGM